MINNLLNKFPKICSDDKDILYLLDDIFDLEKFPMRKIDNENYNRLFHNESQSPSVMDQIKKCSATISENLKFLDNNATKKDVAKALMKATNKTEILLYLSGLYNLTFKEFNNKEKNINIDDIAGIKSIYISEDDDYFIEINKISNLDVKCCICGPLIETYIEPIIFNSPIEQLEFEDKDNNAFFSKIKFYNIEIVPDPLKFIFKFWWTENKPAFNISNLKIQLLNKVFSIIDSSDSENFQISISSTSEYDNRDIQIDECSCSLLLHKNIPSLKINNCSFTKLSLKECFFESIPIFDDKSTVRYNIDIDKHTFKNLSNIEKVGSAEYSRFAEFLNRNQSYIEAQKLHKDYLITKSKETDFFSLKILIWIYKNINYCGNSLLLPFVWLSVIFLISFFIFLLGNNHYFYNYDIANSLQQAFFVDAPFSIIIKKFEISNLLPILQIVIYLLMLLSTFLYYLIFMQIRKLLCLKE